MKNKPSTTALFVAHGMYYNTHQENLKKDIPQDVAQYNSELINHVYNIKSTFAKKVKLTQCSIAQFFTINGFYLHFLVRKKCIEKHVIEAIEQGAKQVVMLGAGYDTSCTRLAVKYPSIHFVEIDHPATAQNKTDIFADLHWNFKNIQYVSANLMQIDDVINSNSIDKTLKTVFICEGVSMYLPAQKVAEMLEKLSANFKEDSTFIFTFMEEHNKGDFQFQNAKLLVKLLLKIKNEPFTWGITSDALNDFATKHGWQVNKIYNHDTLRQHFLSPQNANLPVAIGENIAICTNKK